VPIRDPLLKLKKKKKKIKEIKEIKKIKKRKNLKIGGQLLTRRGVNIRIF